MSGINWSHKKVVIFDVDGTLYIQKKLRLIMWSKLIQFYIFRPLLWHELLILQRFRHLRKKLANDNCQNLEKVQFEVVARSLRIKEEKVKKLIDKWIFKFPLPYLKETIFDGVKDFFSLLKQNGVKIAIFSDYPANEKLASMGLNADLVISATDPFIDKLKPNSTAIDYIQDFFRVKKNEMVLLGDRDELDGQAARNAGIEYIIIPKEDLNTYYNLISDYENSN